MASEPVARIGPVVFKPAVDAQRPISAEIVDQAVDWLVKMQSGGASAGDSDACSRWRQSHPDHERAWLRVCGLGHDLRAGTNGITAHVARAALRGTDRQQRRWALKAVAGLGVGTWAAWAMRHDIALLSADFRTAAGERREVVLPDGTRVVLNTRSAIDARFDAGARTLRLLGGEIMVTTARDPAQRPFMVLGRDGRVRPVGTRFVVREFDQGERRTEVTVLEGAVDVSPGESLQVTRVPAGRRMDFSSAGTGRLDQPAAGAAAWADGMLVVERMRLDDFVAELARYRSGVLRCDPAVAGVLVSGAFPLADTEAVLSMLGETLPVRVRSLSRYWVTVAAR